MPKFDQQPKTSREGSTVNAAPVAMRLRVASLSAGCPRRAPIRRGPQPALHSVSHLHVDPVAPPPVERIAAKQQAVVRGASARKKSTSPPHHIVAVSSIAVAPASLQGMKDLRARRSLSSSISPPQQHGNENAGPQHSQRGSKSRDGSPMPSICVSAQPVKQTAAANTPLVAPRIFGSSVQGNVSLPPSAANKKSTLAAVVQGLPVPASAMKTEDDTTQRLRAEVATLSERNIDLEIDNANMAARVLELEGESSLLKASLSEWRRKYASLEMQLQFQETGNARKLEEEKALLMKTLQEQVAGQWTTVKEKFDEKERGYLQRILELEARLK